MQQVVCKMCSVGNRTGITPLALAIAGIKSLPRNEVFARIPGVGVGGGGREGGGGGAGSNTMRQDQNAHISLFCNRRLS